MDAHVRIYVQTYVAWTIAVYSYTSVHTNVFMRRCMCLRANGVCANVCMCLFNGCRQCRRPQNRKEDGGRETRSVARPSGAE